MIDVLHAIAFLCAINGEGAIDGRDRVQRRCQAELVECVLADPSHLDRVAGWSLARCIVKRKP
jgi:hypothetical protein